MGLRRARCAGSDQRLSSCMMMAQRRVFSNKGMFVQRVEEEAEQDSRTAGGQVGERRRRRERRKIGGWEGYWDGTGTVQRMVLVAGGQWAEGSDSGQKRAHSGGSCSGYSGQAPVSG